MWGVMLGGAVADWKAFQMSQSHTYYDKIVHKLVIIFLSQVSCVYMYIPTVRVHCLITSTLHQSYPNSIFGRN